MKRRDLITRAACVAAVLGAFAYVGTDDHRHAQQQADHYRAMVCAGHWPDYHQRIARGDCSRPQDEPAWPVDRP